jgi:hypothetical protein
MEFNFINSMEKTESRFKRLEQRLIRQIQLLDSDNLQIVNETPNTMLQQYQLTCFEFPMSYQALPGFVNDPLNLKLNYYVFAIFFMIYLDNIQYDES